MAPMFCAGILANVEAGSIPFPLIMMVPCLRGWSARSNFFATSPCY